jgi:mono/diheme cytochrome c family protein
MVTLVVGVLLVSACGVASHPTHSRSDGRSMPGNTLLLSLDGVSIRTNAKELLARDDLTTLEVPEDVSYHRTTRYRAVPMADLLSNVTMDGASTLQAKAADGFAAEIPVSLLKQQDPLSPQAYLAIEDAASPWPALPGKRMSAGPFYLVWTGPHTQRISSEYWPYQIVSLSLKADPARRWPALSPDRVATAGASAQRGRRLFAADCLSCHQLDGEGDGTIGPDLDRPMNPTAYFQRAALHRYVRDPASIRHWPGQRMPGFGPDRLSDADIEALLDYLSAVRKHPPA